MMSVDPHYADAEWQVPALRERIAFLEARVTELQASNNEYLDRARNAVEHADANLRTAALNIYRMDWTWAARGTDQPMLIGSKFWVSLRDALEEAEGELESQLALQRPQVERDQWRYQAAQARLAQQKAQGWAGLAEAEAGCPGDMWDEPPNDYWHPLAAEAAAAEWDRFQAAALSGAGSGPG